MLDEDETRELNVGDADTERRMRREIANSNERRRMQSINAGFQSLRTLLPHHEGEKLSKAAILQQTAEYIYQLEQEKTRLLSQNSQLKRLYSLSQQGLTSPASGNSTAMSSAGGNADDTTSPRLKKKRTNTTTATVSLENTSDLLKTSSNEDNAASTVAELSLQLLNEQRLRQRLEERLKTLEQASNINTTTTTQVVTTVAPPSAAASAPAVPVVAAAVASATPTVVVPQPTTNLLPTQPLKMEVVEKQQQTSTVTVQASATSRPPALSARPPPGTILLADKNGMQVKVEAVHGLPQVPVSMSSEVPVALKVADELKSTPVITAVATQPGTAGATATSRSFIVTTGGTTTAASAVVPSASNSASTSRQNLDSIVEAIRHLEGDHLFSEDSHKVVKEEVVEYTATPTNLSHHISVSKTLVPSKFIGLKPLPVTSSTQVTLANTVVTGTNPIPATLLPKQPHPPSVVLQQHKKDNSSNSIIIVKQCQA